MIAKSIIALGGGLLLLVTLGEGVSRGGACAGPRHYAVVGVAGGRLLQRGRRVSVRFGLLLRKRGGWPACRGRVKELAVVAELSRSRSRQGPWRVIARGRTRKAFWTPPAVGLHWLRVQARDHKGRLHTRIKGVFVGGGTVRIPPTGARFVRAQLWAGGRGTDVVATTPSSRASHVVVPRAAGWWLLTGSGGRKAWVRVTGLGAFHITWAPSTLRLLLGDIVRKGWQVWIHHAGMPRISIPCRRECVLGPLPAGRVELRIRPVTGGVRVIPVPLRLKPGASNRAVLSAMHLLARKPQPATRGWGLFTSPALRTGVGKGKGKGMCRNARPFDGPGGDVALGRAICSRATRRRGSRGSQGSQAWVASRVPPAYLVRGHATTPVVYRKHIVWAQNEKQKRHLSGGVLLYVSTGSGVIVESVPLPQGGFAEGLTVAKNGDVYIVGGTGYASARTGFIAVRRKHGWKVYGRRTAVRAVVAHKRGALALDGRGLVQCARRCRSGPTAPETLTSLVTTGSGPTVVASSGALYAIRGRRLRRTLAKASLGFPLTRVVSGKHGLFGLFGPVIAGSEYHPYCVGSVVARLTRTGWKVVHRVGDLRGGRRLDCQSSDRRPAVVVDIAVAGRTVYARRRAARQGLLRGFRPLYRWKKAVRP